MISRIFANVLARRVAALVVVGVLACLGIDPAFAVTFGSQGEALSQCRSDLAQAKIDAAAKGTYVAPSFVCSMITTEVFQGQNVGVYRCELSETFNGNLYRCRKDTERYYRYPLANTCQKQDPYTGQGPWSTLDGNARNGSLGCRQGCDGFWNSNADGSMTFTPTGGVCPENEKNNCAQMVGYHWNAILAVCEPNDVECKDGEIKKGGKCVEACPAGMQIDVDGTCIAKKGECPPGSVLAPSGQCLPGDGLCAVGEARGKDGTCKRDADGDGKPDAGEEEGTTDETFSGGDSCNAPPACSGSPIMCGQARIQWRIDCNTRKNRNVAGGACSTPPACTGEKCDAVEVTSLHMQWRSACAAEKLLAKTNGEGDGGQPEWTKVGGMNQNPGAGEQASDKPKLNDKDVNTDDLDQSGFGGGSCIGFAGGGGSGISSGFLQTMASPPAFWCTFIAILKGAFVLIGAIASVIIIAKGA